MLICASKHHAPKTIITFVHESTLWNIRQLRDAFPVIVGIAKSMTLKERSSRVYKEVKPRVETREIYQNGGGNFRKSFTCDFIHTHTISQPKNGIRLNKIESKQ